MVLSNYIGSYLTARSDVIFLEKQEALLNAPSGDMHVAAIIAAGGRGRRIGGEKPKQFQTLGDRSLLSWAVRPFSLSSRIREIVVVLPHDELSTSLDSFANGGTVVKLAEGGWASVSLLILESHVHGQRGIGELRWQLGKPRAQQRLLGRQVQRSGKLVVFLWVLPVLIIPGW